MKMARRAILVANYFLHTAQALFIGTQSDEEFRRPNNGWYDGAKESAHPDAEMSDGDSTQLSDAQREERDG